MVDWVQASITYFRDGTVKSDPQAQMKWMAFCRVFGTIMTSRDFFTYILLDTWERFI